MTTWETSFVAMSLALGMSAEDAASALGDEGRDRAAGLLQALGQPARASRAKALASAIAVIAVDVERARLT